MFRHSYERELNRLWADLHQLTEKDPRLEGLYGRDVDPRVARLVQSAAFGFAAIDERLHDDGQALIRPLMAGALPEALRPRPACTIVEFAAPRPSVGEGRGQVIAGHANGVTLPFEVVWPVTVAPFRLADARVDRIHAGLQVLRVVLKGHDGVALGTVLPDVVRIFIALQPCRVALDFLHALCRSRDPVRATAFTSEGRRLFDGHLPPRAATWVRVDTDEAPLVSAPADRFRSGTLLRDLFSFPESFSFIDIRVASVRHESIARLELTLPLARVIESVADLDAHGLRLGCSPATNQYLTELTPLRPNGESQWALSIAHRPHAEVLHVRSIYIEPSSDANARIPIRSWEAPESPHRFDRGETYYALAQASSLTEDRTETRLALRSLSGSSRPAGTVQGEVLASDGALTARLGLGDVASASEGIRNMTRIVPSERVTVGVNRPWRLLAYANMPAVRFAEAVHLTEFLRLHDDARTQEGDATHVHPPRFVSTSHQREHRLVDGVFQWGDAFTLDVDASGCNTGEIAVLGEILARACAERSERLRSARLMLRSKGELLAEYDVREGERLPFLFG